MTISIEFPARPTVVAIIQCAMEMEAAPLRAALHPCAGSDTVTELVVGMEGHAQQRFALGALDGHDVLLVKSGIGLANSASATARALTLVDSPIVIAAGTTGGLATAINVSNIAAGTSTIYSQADATAFGYAMGQVPQMPEDYRSSDETVARVALLAKSDTLTVMTGRVLSSDSFITAPIAQPMREKFPDAIGADMETCAMAEVAWSSGVDWVSLRAVSDLCGPAADQDFHMDSEKAAGISALAVRTFLTL
ncbi:5'-methylthioadenosine/S-adenosylhomocysteine nucleosidase [Schaalia turicensis]|uniref:5'-methylthioadenosine/S-adenosylhomocysteine nucleosidase n=1 Tax=Schaalia turicensis TaxID=131111 RepID=UPI00189B76E3|nr:5'-methylthioadenosine/S-adenosylhomocysteine nucleosidase [Schaalia turicensis]